MGEAFFSSMRALFKVPTVLQYAERRPLCVLEQVKHRYGQEFVYFTRKARSTLTESGPAFCSVLAKAKKEKGGA